MIKKHVLAGGPSSGKTSILLNLEQRGEKIIRECAEDYIRVMQARGIKKPWEDPNFQKQLLEIQIRREKEYENTSGKIFLDGGLLDFFAYFEADRKDMDTETRRRIQEYTKHAPYSKIFLVENMGQCLQTRVRRETQEEAIKLEKLIIKHYGGDNNIIHVSRGTLDKRTKFILDNI